MKFVSYTAILLISVSHQCNADNNTLFCLALNARLGVICVVHPSLTVLLGPVSSRRLSWSRPADIV